MNISDRKRLEASGGWMLSELLVVLVLTAFLSAVLVQTVLCLQRCLAHWEQSARMRQTLSAALFIMSRDVRLAGSNPTGEADFDGLEVMASTAGAPGSIRLGMDKRGAEVGSRPDGDIQDPDEVIAYRWDETRRVLRRNNQPLAAGIVENPGGFPVFEMTSDSQRGLLRLFVTTGASEGSLSLSTAVHLRNPF